MKKIPLTALALALVITTWAQVNPRINEKIAPIKNLQVKPVLLLNSVYYIVSNGFWAADIRNNKVVTSPCVSRVNEFQWKTVTNSDGTITILSQANNNLKIVNQKSNIQLPSAGLRSVYGSGSNSDGYALMEASARSTDRTSIVDKFYLNRINDEYYWLVGADHKDSSQIKLFGTADVNAINFTFTNLEGWVVTEGSAGTGAFAGQPSSVNHIPFFTSPVIPNMPLGGSYWNELEDLYFSFDTKTDSRYINTSRPGDNRWAAPNDTKTGVILSLPFISCGEKITYRIAGTQDAANIKVEFLQRIKAPEAGSVALPDGNYKIINSTTGHGNDITRMIVVDAHAQKYQVCRFRITDNSATGHIIADAFDLSYPGQLSSEPKPADPEIPANKPIWGAIDMHTHPMSFMGMGGKLMHGKLDGDPNVALGNCNCIHGGWGTDNTCGNYFRAEIVNMIDEYYQEAVRLKAEDMKLPHTDHPHDGYPALIHWPVQSSMVHQQMWYEWLQRARQGGLSAIIALTVNSEVLGRALGGDPPYDDKTVADRQIDSLIAFVRRHRDFIDTVTSAARMRQVVREGRMAVIIGMEVDNLGNFYENVPASNEQIRAEIIRLKNKGVRYVFPIHVTDNKFGGSAVYKELFNFSNKYVTAQPITGTVPVDAWPPIMPGHLFKVETAPDRNVGFRLEGKTFSMVTKMRPLIEIIEAGGFPVLPPPLDVPSLAIKPVVDPVIMALKLSQQYQLAKKIFIDRNPEFDTYESIERSKTDRGGHRNVSGLSDQGIFAVTEMMKQGLMIDVDHASEKSVNDMIAIAQRNNYPVNSGHNGLRQPNDNEKTRTPQQFEAIRNLGGMFGMGWENQTPVDFNRGFNRHLALMGGRNATFGSDIDGYAATTKKPVNSSQFINYTDRSKPDFLQQYRMPGSSRVWDYNTGGMAHIGMVPDFFQALKEAGVTTSQLNALFLSAEYFAQMWEKCERTAPAVR